MSRSLIFFIRSRSCSFPSAPIGVHPHCRSCLDVSRATFQRNNSQTQASRWRRIAPPIRRPFGIHRSTPRLHETCNFSSHAIPASFPRITVFYKNVRPHAVVYRVNILIDRSSNLFEWTSDVNVIRALSAVSSINSAFYAAFPSSCILLYFITRYR